MPLSWKQRRVARPFVENLRCRDGVTVTLWRRGGGKTLTLLA